MESEGEEEAEGRHSLSHRARAMSGARSLVFCLRYDATARPRDSGDGRRGWFVEERDHGEEVGRGRWRRRQSERESRRWCATARMSKRARGESRRTELGTG